MPDGAILRDIDGNVRFVIKITDITSIEEDLSDRIRNKSKKLIPAIELDDVSVTLVAIDTLAEFRFGKERHKLCEDSFSGH